MDQRIHEDVVQAPAVENVEDFRSGIRSAVVTWQNRSLVVKFLVEKTLRTSRDNQEAYRAKHTLERKMYLRKKAQDPALIATVRL